MAQLSVLEAAESLFPRIEGDFHSRPVGAHPTPPSHRDVSRPYFSPRGHLFPLVSPPAAEAAVSMTASLARLEYLYEGRDVPSLQFVSALIRGVSDCDGQEAGKDFEVVTTWYRRRKDRLGPTAHQAYGVYERYVRLATQQGTTRIDGAALEALVGELSVLASRRTMAAELHALELGWKRDGELVSGRHLAAALCCGIENLNGVDLEAEYRAVSQWALENRQHLSGAARAVLSRSEAHVASAIARGTSSVTGREYDDFQRDLFATAEAFDRGAASSAASRVADVLVGSGFLSAL